MTIKDKEIIHFSCPNCLGDLYQEAKGQVDTLHNLVCKKCNLEFPKRKNIYRFVSQNNYTDSFGYQWNKFRKTQLDSFTGLPISSDRLIRATSWENDLSDKVILEAGSGAGRFTENIVKTKGNVFSFDFSTAVEANYLNNGSAENLEIFQGDIFNIPFKDRFFDYIVCLGVIQHTPDPRLAFLSLSKKLKPGGSIYIDCYALKWHHLLQWKYLLRPITKRINQDALFKIIAFICPLLIPLVKCTKILFGKMGGRLFPIVEYSELNLGKEINKEWSILDTFDMYSPEHDHPQTKKEVRSWFDEDEFENIQVWYGDNGIVARSIKSIKN